MNAEYNYEEFNKNNDITRITHLKHLAIIQENYENALAKLDTEKMLFFASIILQIHSQLIEIETHCMARSGIQFSIKNNKITQLDTGMLSTYQLPNHNLIKSYHRNLQEMKKLINHRNKYIKFTQNAIRLKNWPMVVLYYKSIARKIYTMFDYETRIRNILSDKIEEEVNQFINTHLAV
jgi:hypothetical protein